MSRDEFYERLKNLALAAEAVDDLIDDLEQMDVEAMVDLLVGDDDAAAKALAQKIFDVKTMPEALAYVDLTIGLGITLTEALYETLFGLMPEDKSENK